MQPCFGHDHDVRLSGSDTQHLRFHGKEFDSVGHGKHLTGGAHAYSANNLGVELYNSNQAPGRPRPLRQRKQIHYADDCERQGLCGDDERSGRVRSAADALARFASSFTSSSFRNFPLSSSSNAWRSCSCVFMTMGPYQATGSSSGFPETSRNVCHRPRPAP